MTDAVFDQGGWPSDWPPHEKIVVVARAIAGSADGAETLASFAHQKALQAPPDGRRLQLSWFRKVMQNRWHERRRRRRLVGFLPALTAEVRENLASHWATPEESAMQREAAQDLLNAMLGISGRRRRILELKYFQGLTNAAVATELGVSLATVEREHRVALESLGRILDDHHTSFRSSIAVLLGAGQAYRAKAVVAGVSSVWSLKAWFMAALMLLLVGSYLGYQSLMGHSLSGQAADASVQPLAPPSVLGGMDRASELDVLAEEDVERLAARESLATDESAGSLMAPESIVPAYVSGNTSAVTDTQNPTRFYTIVLEVDGRRAVDWKSFEPMADPDGYELRGVDPPRCVHFQSTSEDGTFSYELPEAVGPWVFRFSHDETWSGIWLRDSGTDAAPRIIRVATTTATLLRPELHTQGLAATEALLLANPEPGVWFGGAALHVDQKTGAWTFPQVLAGRVRLVRLTGQRDPDQWPVLAGPWRTSATDANEIR